jgi:hypothetical protein
MVPRSGKESPSAAGADSLLFRRSLHNVVETVEQMIVVIMKDYAVAGKRSL